MPILGDPQGTQARAIDTERKYPAARAQEPPPSYRRKQLLVLAALIGVPALVYAFTRLLG